MAADQIGRQKLGMPGQRSEPHHAIALRLAAQLVEFGDVDQKLRRRKPHVEAGEQALATRDRHRLASRIRQDPAGLLEKFPA